MMSRFNQQTLFIGMPIIGLLCLVIAYQSTAGEFRQREYPLQLQNVKLDSWSKRPPDGWAPTFDDRELGLRLPFDWQPTYREKYKQLFQPVVFYNNAIALCNYAERHPAQKEETARLFDQLFERSSEFIDRDGDRLWVRMDFDFKRPKGTGTLNAPWYSSLNNAFVIAGLVRATDCFDKPDYLATLKGLVAAFSVVHTHGQTAPKRWFTYIDENQYLWFDEYPHADGRSSRVLNGDIHSLIALVLYANKFKDAEVLALIHGNLATLRDNVQRFRRKGKINSYELLTPSHPDYAPNRTVRQQCQLYKLTGDTFFRNMASTFKKDNLQAGIAPDALAEEHCR